MREDFLGERRNALEDAFFAQHNQRLLPQFRETMAAKATQEALAAASGITDAGDPAIPPSALRLFSTSAWMEV